MWMWSRSYLLSEHFFWQFVSICDQRKELRFLKKKSRSCYDYWKEVKCLMRILCVKVIWEAEALIFQNSSGKFMNIVKSYICDNVFTEGFEYLLTKFYFVLQLQLYLDSLLFWEVSWSTATQWKIRLCHVSKQFIKQS